MMNLKKFDSNSRDSPMLKFAKELKKTTKITVDWSRKKAKEKQCGRNCKDV